MELRPAASSDRVTRLYAAALLKVALELRRPNPCSLELLLDRVLEGTPVDRQLFTAYLRRNFSLLRGV